MAHDRLGKLLLVRRGNSKRGASGKLLGSFCDNPIVGMAQNQGPPALTKIDIGMSVNIGDRIPFSFADNQWIQSYSGKGPDGRTDAARHEGARVAVELFCLWSH